MNKLCLLVLLVAIASAKNAIDVTGISDDTKLHCFVSMSISKATIEVLSQSGTINQNFMNTWVSARDAGFSGVDAIVVVNDHTDVNTLADQVTHALPGRFDGVAWLKVIDSPQLWSQDMSKRILFLDSLVLAFKQHGVTAGVYSDANSWSRVMDSQDAGSDTLKAAPVWYIGNDDSSFKDFSYAGFGTWKKADQKLNRGTVSVCSTLTNFIYFEK